MAQKIDLWRSMLLNIGDWLVVTADRGIGADSFADELVESLRAQQLKVECLFKLSWRVGVEPDLQNHLTAGWYNPTKFTQPACKYTRKDSKTSKTQCVLVQSDCICFSCLCLRFRPTSSWLCSCSAMSVVEVCEDEWSKPFTLSPAVVRLLLFWLSLTFLSLSFITPLSL